jgi:magnesium transporter
VVIIDCAVYEKGKRATDTLPIERALDHVGDEAFVWLGLYEPTREEFEAVRIEFGLHELAAEDAVAAHQRPKLELYRDSLLVVLKTARYIDETEEIEFGEIILLVGKQYVVIVRHGKASELGAVRRALEDNPDRLGHGPTAVLHAVMDRVVDDYAPVVAGLENDISEVELDVFSPESTNPTERIYFLRREVLEFRTAVQALLEPLLRLSKGEVAQMMPGSEAYFRDVYDHAVRTLTAVDQDRDLLTSVLEANLTQIGVRQNEDMRKISAWVAVGVVPTVIAGIFGMNFVHIPGLDRWWGFPTVLILMALVALALYNSFRRSGWL